MRILPSAIKLILVVSTASCAGHTIYDPPASDGSVIDVAHADATDASSGETPERPKTCADVGKGYGSEACCEGAYCAGICEATAGKCKCAEVWGGCPSNTVCCPGVGCASRATCDKVRADAG